MFARIPQDARLGPEDAGRLIEANFAERAGCELLTRDRRAIGTYTRLTARARFLPDGSPPGGV